MIFGVKKILSKEDPLQRDIKKKLYEVIRENFQIKFMILSMRLLKTSEEFFINEYIKYLLSLWKDKERLVYIYNSLENGKVDFIFTKVLPEKILYQCFNVFFIPQIVGKIWEDIDEDMPIEEIKDVFLDLIDQKLSTLDISKDIKSQIERSKSLLKYAFDFKTENFLIKDKFFKIVENEKVYIYTIYDYMTLDNIKSFAYFVENKNNYEIVILPENLFYFLISRMREYRANRVYGLDQIKNPFLITYLVNNMTSLDFGDLNITYFYRDEYNPYKINVSVRYKGQYKFIEIKGVTDFDLNQLDADIVTLGGKLGGLITVTDIKVGRFSYRCLIIRANGIYFLNLRKVEGILYTPEELEEKSGVNVRYYLINKNNKKIRLNPNLKLKHFNIDYPLAYSEEDIELIFLKLASAIKGTFWINGKTNSWKTTSMKNLLVKYYEYHRKVNKENKNIMMLENPIEGYDYYFKQIEVDDESYDDYKSILLAIKRADLDMCVVGELRNYEVFGIVNEISNSLPLISTFHVGTIEAFLSILKYYADKSGLNYLDVFNNVNLSIVQVPLPVDFSDDKIYYTLDDIDDLKKEMVIKFKLDRDDLEKEEIIFRDKMFELVEVMLNKGYKILKRYGSGKRYILFYEILTNDMLSVFLTRKFNKFAEVYNYIGFENTILYKTLKQFVSGNLIFDNIKFDDYSIDIRIKILDKIIKDLRLDRLKV